MITLIDAAACGRPAVRLKSRPTTSLLAAVAAAVIAMALPVSGHEPDFSELLSGRIFPLTVTLKDLGSSWRRITIQNAGSVRDNISVNVSGNSNAATSQNNLVGMLSGSRAYLTEGRTVSAAGQTYLVAYHLPGSGLDLGSLLQAIATKSPPSMQALTPETVLPLALLDLRTIGSLDDIRVLDAASEIRESARAAQMLADLMKAQGDGKPTNAPPAAAQDQEKSPSVDAPKEETP